MGTEHTTDLGDNTIKESAERIPRPDIGRPFCGAGRGLYPSYATAGHDGEKCHRVLRRCTR